MLKQDDNSFPCDDAAEEDVTLLLEHPVDYYFMQVIGVQKWMCELGWIDV